MVGFLYLHRVYGKRFLLAFCTAVPSLLSNLQFDLSFIAQELAKLLARKLRISSARTALIEYYCSALGLESGELRSACSGILSSNGQTNCRWWSNIEYRSVFIQYSQWFVYWPSRWTNDRFLLVGSDSSVSKLSVISQRENILSAIGVLSRASSANLSQDGISKLLEKSFYSMIQQEVHEGLICHMLQQMSGWCTRLTTLNPLLTEFFKVTTSRSFEPSELCKKSFLSSTERSGT